MVEPVIVSSLLVFHQPVRSRSGANWWTKTGWRAGERASRARVRSDFACCLTPWGSWRWAGGSTPWWLEGGQTDSCLRAGNHTVQSHGPAVPPGGSGRTGRVPPQREQQVGPFGRGSRLSDVPTTVFTSLGLCPPSRLSQQRHLQNIYILFIWHFSTSLYSESCICYLFEAKILKELANEQMLEKILKVLRLNCLLSKYLISVHKLVSCFHYINAATFHQHLALALQLNLGGELPKIFAERRFLLPHLRYGRAAELLWAAAEPWWRESCWWRRRADTRRQRHEEKSLRYSKKFVQWSMKSKKSLLASKLLREKRQKKGSVHLVSRIESASFQTMLFVSSLLTSSVALIYNSAWFPEAHLLMFCHRVCRGSWEK